MTASRAFAQPTAANDSFSTPQATPLTVPAIVGVLSNDSGDDDDDDEGLEAVLVSNVSNGALLLGANGGFFYLPNLGFTGNDSFTYQARQDGELSNVATATISVTSAGGVNVPPVASGDSYSINEDQTLNVGAGNGVLANDTDADANSLTAVLIDSVGNGTLALQPDGSFSFTPPPDFSGATSFTYQPTTARSAATPRRSRSRSTPPTTRRRRSPTAIRPRRIRPSASAATACSVTTPIPKATR